MAGTFNFTITATDTSSGCLGSRAYTVVIAAAGCPAITLNPAVLPPGTVGLVYNQTITATGGTGATVFAITSGSLPPGLTLNPATGVISGTPILAGLSSFTIGSTDANACPGSRAYTIAIVNGNPVGGPTLDFVGLMILMALLAGAGLFVIKRFSI